MIAIPLLGISPREMKAHILTKLHTKVHSSFSAIAKTRNNPNVHHVNGYTYSGISIQQNICHPFKEETDTQNFMDEFQNNHRVMEARTVTKRSTCWMIP